MTVLSYFLAVDVGTSRIAAATARIAADGSIVTAPFALGRKSDSVATVVFVADDGELSFGDVAERRGVAQPERLIREFKRSIGDDVPIVVGGRSLPAEQLYAQTVAEIIAMVTEREGQSPEAVSLTHPTAWGGHRIELIRAALTRVGVRDVELITEPEAAARHYEASRSFELGQTLAVYDLGGGTFDSVVLRKEVDGSFGLIGDPIGIDDLGGADFDDAVMRHVIAAADIDVAELAVDDAATRQALSQLRRECVDAKEALSFDSEVTIPVLIPPHHTSVRLTRSEFEEMITASLGKTMDALDEAIESAGLEADQLESILLIGGSSRIPRVTQVLSERFDRPIAIDADPKAAIALGAARTALIRQHDRYLAAPGSELALLGGAAGALALVQSDTLDLASLPAPKAPPSKARKSSPFVLSGAAVLIAGAIVFASTLSAGSRGNEPDASVTSSSTPTSTPTPKATPIKPIPAAAVVPAAEVAPVEDTSSRESNSNPNPRRAAAQTATPAPTAKPTSPPATADASGQTPSTPSDPAPTETVPDPTPTETVPDPTPTETVPDPTPTETVPDPTPTETVPDPTPTETVPDPAPTTPEPEPVVPTPEPTNPV